MCFLGIFDAFLIFFENYLSHFAPNFLFIEGDKNPRHHAPGNGLLYFWEMITIPLGLYLLFESKVSPKGRWVILLFLLLAPIAAAPTESCPHAIRSLNALPGWITLSSLGFNFFLKKKKRFCYLLIVLGLGNFIYWFNLYFLHLPFETSQFWQYGYKEVVFEVLKKEREYDKVLVTGKYDQPYIFFLF